MEPRALTGAAGAAGVARQAWSPQDFATRLVAPAGPPAWAGSEPPSPQEWEALVGHVVRWRLEGYLAAAVEAGALPVTPEQAASLAELEAEAMGWVVVLERALLDVLGRLDAVGVPTRVLKGVAHAYLDHPDPRLRPFGDVDLLVPGARLGDAHAVLAGLGGVRAHEEYRPGFDERFTKGFAMRLPDGVEIDVHRTFVLGPFGLAVRVEELWEPAEHVPIGGRQVAVLPRPLRFLHASYHAVVKASVQSPLHLRDIAGSAPRGAAEVATVVATARRWRGGIVVATAVQEAAGALAWDPPPALRDWAFSYRPSRRERRWLAASRVPTQHSAVLTAVGLAALPRWSDKLAYGRAVIWPDGLGPRGQLTRWRRSTSQLAGWLRSRR